MTSTQKRIFAICLIMAAVVFVLVAFPNGSNSQNLAMVQMFQPDEAAPFPALTSMIAPAPSAFQALHNFVFYEYYFYGFPYFASSALVILPLQWLGRIQDMPTVMLVLRQLISVLPMLATLLLLVFMQDGFRTYRSPVTFAFLLSVPAVLANNFWWHADSLTFLFVALTIFFLWRDDLRLGKNFLLAALTCGIATAIKEVGLDFFLAVGAALLLALIMKKAPLKRVIGRALVFLGIMLGSFLVSNPFLVSGWARTSYIQTFQLQQDLLSQGYGIVYDRGLVASWPIMHPYYGEAVFLVAAIALAAWAAWRGPNAWLNRIIMAWFIPVTVTVLVFTHFKYQYWLPAALPVFSSLVIVLPEKLKVDWAGLKKSLLPAVIVLIFASQFAAYMVSNVQAYNAQLHQSDNNQRIAFYTQAVNALKPLGSSPLSVYYDYRLYMPDTPNWKVETSYDLLDYNYIHTGNFGVLLLLKQRIRDYLLPSAVGIDPQEFALNQQFYRDARDGKVAGYHLVFQNDVGLVYVRQDLYQQYFQ